MAIIKAIGPVISQAEAISWVRRLRPQWETRDFPVNDLNVWQAMSHHFRTQVRAGVQFPKSIKYHVRIHTTPKYDFMISSTYIISPDETQEEWSKMTPGQPEIDLVKWLEEKEGVTCVPDTFYTYVLDPQQEKFFYQDIDQW